MCLLTILRQCTEEVQCKRSLVVILTENKKFNLRFDSRQSRTGQWTPPIKNPGYTNEMGGRRRLFAPVPLLWSHHRHYSIPMGGADGRGLNPPELMLLNSKNAVRRSSVHSMQPRLFCNSTDVWTTKCSFVQISLCVYVHLHLCVKVGKVIVLIKWHKIFRQCFWVSSF